MKRPRLGRLILRAAVVATSLACAGAAAGALGGPVIIGGDDLTDHGSVDGAGDLQQGWLYLQRALENVSPKVVKPGAGSSVAALGSAASLSTGGDAGAAIGRAAAKVGLTVDYYEGASAINGFFSALAAGTTNPRIIWIAGTGASNDLDSSEGAALTANATAIADFVNAGGGLVSHGSEYGWLFALLPGLDDVGGGSSGDLYLTPAGAAAFPGVTAADVNAGPWHNHFEGNFGGLEVLVRSSDIQDSNTAEDAAVVIGGASVTLPGAIVLTPGTATNPPGTSHTVTATVRDQAGAPLSGATVTFSVTAGPNAGVGATVVTDANGQASFTYTSNGATGTDTIRASFVDATQTTRSDTATKIWGTGSAPAPTPPADIGVTKVDSPDPVVVGANLTYTMVVTNHGPGAALSAAMTDVLPTGVTFVSMATTRGSCSLASATVTCSFGTMAAGESATVTIVVRVDQPGTLVNTAGVSTTVSDPNVANNQIAVAATTAQAPFTPPATPSEPAAPAGCSLTTGTSSVFAGIRSTLVFRARADDGSARAGVAVTLRGAGPAKTVRTNAQGVARFTVAPRQAGRLTARGAGCGAALTVAAVVSRSCAGVTVSPLGATVGSGAAITVRVRIAGRAAVGVRVLARGAGLSLSAVTNSAGIATLRGTATRPGVVEITVPGVLACSRRLGVSGAFQPPEVTG